MRSLMMSVEFQVAQAVLIEVRKVFIHSLEVLVAAVMANLQIGHSRGRPRGSEVAEHLDTTMSDYANLDGRRMLASRTAGDVAHGVQTRMTDSGRKIELKSESSRT